MRALLLSAGYGLRLKPITDTLPKCLVRIKGKPLLEIWLEKLIKANLGPFLINTHYLNKKVEKFAEESVYKKHITLKYEKKLLGTAGTFIKNEDFFQGRDGLLIHADNYCEDDLTKLIVYHNNRPKKCLMTMMIFETKDPSSCGIVKLDKEGIVKKFYEKDSKNNGNLANAAIYVISPEFIKIVKKNYNDSVNFSEEIISKFIGKIYTYKTNKFFLDIGTVKSYKSIA